MKNMIEEKRKKWNMWKERWRRQWQRGDQRIVREREQREKSERDKEYIHSLQPHLYYNRTWCPLSVAILITFPFFGIAM